MTVRKTLTALLLIVTASLSYASDIFMFGEVTTETGVNLTEELSSSMLQNTFDLKFEYSGSDSYMLFNPVVSHSMDREVSLDVRELYADIYFDRMDLRIGKQQIIWGKTDGLFITDVVSPKDLRQFLLPDLKDVRMGVTAVRADYYVDDITFEAVWIPVFTPNRMPEASSPWNAQSIDFSDSDQNIAAELMNSELFARISLYSSNLDLEVVGGMMWDDEPYPVGPGTFDHARLGVLGGSLSTEVAGLILRGEAALYTGKPFRVSTVSFDHIEKDYLHAMVGIDYRSGTMMVSTQFIEKVILDYDQPLAADQWNHTMTLLVNREIPSQHLDLKLFTYLEFDEFNALISPSVHYDLSDAINISIGAHLFYGETGTFGQFDDQDLIHAEITLSF
jgi:hypothetical protein